MLVFLLHSMKLLFTKPIPPNPAPSKIIPIISETLYIYLIGFQLGAGIGCRTGISNRSLDEKSLRLKRPSENFFSDGLFLFYKSNAALIKRLV